MPERPPSAWMEAATSAIAARGGVADPAAVAASVWQRMTASRRRAAVALYEGKAASMAKKKSKKPKKKATKTAKTKKKAAKKSKKAVKAAREKAADLGAFMSKLRGIERGGK